MIDQQSRHQSGHIFFLGQSATQFLLHYVSMILTTAFLVHQSGSKPIRQKSCGIRKLLFTHAEQRYPWKMIPNHVTLSYRTCCMSNSIITSPYSWTTILHSWLTTPLAPIASLISAIMPCGSQSSPSLRKAASGHTLASQERVSRPN